MKSPRKLEAAAFLLAMLVCGASRARSIQIDGWHVDSTGTGKTAVIEPATSPLPINFALEGVNYLSFKPGGNVKNYAIEDILLKGVESDGGDFRRVEIAWGSAGFPSEQLVLFQDSLDPAEFTVDFDYNQGVGPVHKAYGGLGTKATFTVNDSTYVVKAPALLSDAEAQMTFKDGVLEDSSFYTNGPGKHPTSSAPWKEKSKAGSVSAPEIDPASTGSALALLLVGLAILSSRRKGLLAAE